jgi:hypothetical protein
VTGHIGTHDLSMLQAELAHAVLCDGLLGSEGARAPAREENVMPEVYICEFCVDVIDPTADQYVVTNRATATDKDHWKYAHAKCYRQHRQGQGGPGGVRREGGAE